MPPTAPPSTNPDPTSKRPALTLAEILSDLTSLRLCDPAAALALVSARPSKTNATSIPNPDPNHETTKCEQADKDDPDLQRAKDLVELHYSIKEAHKRGELEKGLAEAREMVRKAVEGA